MTEPTDAVQAVRNALRDFPDLAASRASQAPAPESIYTPATHAAALDPDRTLVVGARGVGKSFWAAVLGNPQTRARAAWAYPRLELDRHDVALGYHEGARGTSGIAPSPRALADAYQQGAPDGDTADIWRAVLLRALLDTGWVASEPADFTACLDLVRKDPDAVDDHFLAADERLAGAGRHFLLVFDALDRLGRDWDIITELSRGLARFALDLKTFDRLRAKLFMRRDQFDDRAALSFPDASKIVNAKVDLYWRKSDLLGWLFAHLWRHEPAGFRPMVAGALGEAAGDELPAILTHDETAQRAVFARIAGPYMGADKRRGLTDRKIVNALADAFGETSLRSFAAALKQAAEQAHERGLAGRPLDHPALNAGISRASRIRVEELMEDHPWVEDVLHPLHGLTVPSEKDQFIERWKEAKTLEIIRRRADTAEEAQAPSVPIALRNGGGAADLLEALKSIGVIEERTDQRINVPDLFRVAARMKRRGGIRPDRS